MSSRLRSAIVREKNYPIEHVSLSRSPKNNFPRSFETKDDEYCTFLCKPFIFHRSTPVLTLPSIFSKCFCPSYVNLFSHAAPAPQYNYISKISCNFTKKTCKFAIMRLKHKNLRGITKRVERFQ